MALTQSRFRKRRKPPAARPEGPAVGRVVGLDGAGRPLVDYPGNPAGEAVAARPMFAPSAEYVGREVVLIFERHDPARPIALGVLHSEEKPKRRKRSPVRVRADGEEVTLTADRELVLECGEASITLTRAGKVLICGTYVLTRSCGVNAIQGGSVQIN